VVRDLPLHIVATHLDLKSLYRMNWGGTGLKGEEWEKMQVEFDIRRLRMLAKAAGGLVQTPGGLWLLASSLGEMT
jgi:hypothetical protein